MNLHMQKTTSFFNRENIDTTVQGPELQCFLKVDFSLRCGNLTNKTGYQDILKSKLSVYCLNDTYFYTGLYFLKSYCLVLKANNILKVVSVVAHSRFEWKNKVFPLFYF